MRAEAVLVDESRSLGNREGRVQAEGDFSVSASQKTCFGTDDNVTREQMAAILYRYSQYKGYDVTKTADLSVFTDASGISGWARTAMNWANAEGRIKGRTTVTLVPGGSATRAEVATVLQRFVEGFVK